MVIMPVAIISIGTEFAGSVIEIDEKKY